MPSFYSSCIHPNAIHFGPLEKGTKRNGMERNRVERQREQFECRAKDKIYLVGMKASTLKQIKSNGPLMKDSDDSPLRLILGHKNNLLCRKKTAEADIFKPHFITVQIVLHQYFQANCQNITAESFEILSIYKMN